jgi:hypothetical protein
MWGFFVIFTIQYKLLIIMDDQFEDFVDFYDSDVYSEHTFSED